MQNDILKQSSASVIHGKCIPSFTIKGCLLIRESANFMFSGVSIKNSENSSGVKISTIFEICFAGIFEKSNFFIFSAINSQKTLVLLNKPEWRMFES